MPTEKRPIKVFLCHAHADANPVRALYTRLTRDGVEAWLDKEKLLPGHDWELEIRKAVRESDVVVVCLSKDFNQEGFRQKEVRLALDTAMEKPEGEIFIIPARLEECDTLESLSKWQWVDFFENKGYEMLIRALKTRADRIGAVLQAKGSKSSKTTFSTLNIEKNRSTEPNQLKPKTKIPETKLSFANMETFSKSAIVSKDRESATKAMAIEVMEPEKNTVQNKKITSTPKSTGKRMKQSTKSTRKLDGIQLASIGVIVLIAVIAIWMFIANRQPAAITGQAPQVTGKQYASEPPMTIDVNKQYFATVKMAKGGQFVIQLFPDKAPRTVNSFVFLARDGFYNGTTFHRVLDGFMAQGGDPTGTGGGGPGYQFPNEKNDLAFDKAGVVAMANAGPDTNGSQFFIMFGPYGLSENDYTIFGQVISGMDVVNSITRRDPSQNPTFPGDTMESVTITEK